jgi:hypothetical protein
MLPVAGERGTVQRSVDGVADAAEIVDERSVVVGVGRGDEYCHLVLVWNRAAAPAGHGHHSGRDNAGNVLDDLGHSMPLTSRLRSANATDSEVTDQGSSDLPHLGTK